MCSILCHSNDCAAPHERPRGLGRTRCRHSDDICDRRHLKSAVKSASTVMHADVTRLQLTVYVHCIHNRTRLAVVLNVIHVNPTR